MFYILYVTSAVSINPLLYVKQYFFYFCSKKIQYRVSLYVLNCYKRMKTLNILSLA
jgi:hypothetical protein